MAESDTIALSYQSVIEDFDVTFANKNREILVGPLQSFMAQMISDGLHVKLSIYKDNILIDSIIKTSHNGYVNYFLKPAVYKDGVYSFTIETAGKTKEFNTKKLW